MIGVLIPLRKLFDRMRFRHIAVTSNLHGNRPALSATHRVDDSIFVNAASTNGSFNW